MPACISKGIHFHLYQMDTSGHFKLRCTSQHQGDVAHATDVLWGMKWACYNLKADKCRSPYCCHTNIPVSESIDPCQAPSSVSKIPLTSNWNAARICLRHTVTINSMYFMIKKCQLYQWVHRKVVRVATHWLSNPCGYSPVYAPKIGCDTTSCRVSCLAKLQHSVQDVAKPFK